MKKHKPAKQLNYKDILEYVCWIADADRLYEFSLATYNLDLVAMVAQQTQKVPIFEYYTFFKPPNRILRNTFLIWML